MVHAISYVMLLTRMVVRLSPFLTFLCSSCLDSSRPARNVLVQS